MSSSTDAIGIDFVKQTVHSWNTRRSPVTFEMKWSVTREKTTQTTFRGIKILTLIYIHQMKVMFNPSQSWERPSTA